MLTSLLGIYIFLLTVLIIWPDLCSSNLMSSGVAVMGAFYFEAKEIFDKLRPSSNEQDSYTYICLYDYFRHALRDSKQQQQHSPFISNDTAVHSSLLPELHCPSYKILRYAQVENRGTAG